MTANGVNRAQTGSCFNPKMTVRGKMYHFFGPLISPQQIRQSYASLYVPDTDEINGSKIRRNCISQHQLQGILIHLGTAIIQTNSYAHVLQSRKEWALRNAPDDYSILIYAQKRTACGHVGRYNALLRAEVVVIIVGVENRKIGTTYIVLPKRDTIKQNGTLGSR